MPTYASYTSEVLHGSRFCQRCGAAVPGGVPLPVFPPPPAMMILSGIGAVLTVAFNSWVILRQPPASDVIASDGLARFVVGDNTDVA